MKAREWTSPAFLDRKFEEVFDIAENSQWEFVANQYDVTISKQSNAGISCMKGAGQIHAPPSAVFDVVWDIPRRKKWDKFVEKASVIRQYEENIKLAHIILTKPLNSRIVSNRDLAVICAYRMLSNGTYVVIVFSVDDDTIPRRDDFVRAELETSGFIIEPDGDNSCWITYIIQMKYKGWLPDILSNRLYQPLRISTLRYCVSDSKYKTPIIASETHRITGGQYSPFPPSPKSKSLTQSVEISHPISDSEEDSECEFHEVNEFCDSIDDLSQLNISGTNSVNLQAYAKILHEETNHIRKEVTQITGKVISVEHKLLEEQNGRIAFQAERKKMETESEERIQRLLSDYLQRINQMQIKQQEMDANIDAFKEQTNQRIERLNQSLLLCFSRVRDSGKYQVYWGCVVFFLWCLWPYLLIKKRVSLVGAKPTSSFILSKTKKFRPQLMTAYKILLAIVITRLPIVRTLIRWISTLLPLRR